MSKLVVVTEGLAQRAFELKADRTTVGRLDDNAFQIQEPSVSSHHCEILVRAEEIVVKDLNSTNGTFINGQRVTEAVLKPGQTLRVGQVELRLENGASHAPAKKPLDQTRVVGGVKMNELEAGTKQIAFDKNSPFSRKSNKVQVFFLWGSIALAVIIVVFLVYAFFLSGKSD